MFKLRIYAPWKCGDMPAATAVYTGGKHHGAQHPCRICPIQGIRILDSNNLNHYLPITHPAGYPPLPYSVTTLPLRTHSEWMRQAKEIDEAPTQNEQRNLSQLYGINRTAIATQITGFRLPWSVPVEFMHLLYNTLKGYVAHFGGDYKDLGAGSESYVIPERIWKDIGAATASSGDTVPSAFGRRIPNMAEDRTFMTAEAYLVWATMYAPILLRGRFFETRYYVHFMRFISIVEHCIDFRSTATERARLREDIHVWYTEYERYACKLPSCSSYH